MPTVNALQQHRMLTAMLCPTSTPQPAGGSPEGEHGNNIQEAHGDVDEGAQHRKEEGVVVHGVRLQLHEDAVARADEDHHYERHNLQWGNPRKKNRRQHTVHSRRARDGR